MKIIGRTHVKIREFTNPFFAENRREKLNNSDFSIFSNNCWAGHVYRYYGLPYKSPTVGLYFYADEYIRFLEKPQYYISQPLKFISYQDSKYREYQMKKSEINVPIGVLDNIEIVFLHYTEEAEAYEKWNRRCERINWNNICLKFSNQNLCTEKHIQTFDKIENDKKFVFVNRPLPDIKSAVYFKGSESYECVEDDTTYFRRYIKLCDWLNGKSPV